MRPKGYEICVVSVIGKMEARMFSDSNDPLTILILLALDVWKPSAVSIMVIVGDKLLVLHHHNLNRTSPDQCQSNLIDSDVVCSWSDHQRTKRIIPFNCPQTLDYHQVPKHGLKRTAPNPSTQQMLPHSYHGRPLTPSITPSNDEPMAGKHTNKRMDSMLPRCDLNDPIMRL